jgi:hypothetical protein
MYLVYQNFDFSLNRSTLPCYIISEIHQENNKIRREKSEICRLKFEIVNGLKSTKFERILLISRSRVVARNGEEREGLTLRWTR